MFSTLTRQILGAGAALTLLGISATAGAAKTLTMAPGFAPGSAAHYGAEAFSKRVEELTRGDIKFTVHPLTLLSVPQMLNGIRDGVADVGTLLPPVFVSQFPESNLIGDLAMLGRSATAMAGATTEYFMTCSDCQREFAKNNVVYLGSGSTAEYGIQSTREFTTVEQLKGAKLRSPNASFNRWIEHFGGVALTLPGNEIFEAVKQGVVNGALLSAGELRNIRMIDVAKHVTEGAPQGTYHLINVSTTNRDAWKALNDEQRRVFLNASAHAIAATTYKYVQDGIDALAEAKQRGITVHQASPQMKERSEAFVTQDLATVQSIADKRGIADAKGKIERYKQLVVKWEGLTKDLGLDVEKLGAVYKSEIFDKLDAAKYGI
jgi:TRAP-type C4-dicarboxylate transport system substrate-binding protein